MIGLRQVVLVGTSAAFSLPALALDARDVAAVVAKQNEYLPRMVAKDLRQERLESSGMTLIYKYTHLSLDSAQLRAMNLAVTQRPYILPGLCTASDTSRTLREGVSYRYVYRGSDGVVASDFVLSQVDCRNQR